MKIVMKTPIVEMNGDEMTRIVWDKIKNELLHPYIDLQTVYYDLGMEERERTKDQITVDAANAIKEYGVGVKCATITPNAARMTEYSLTEMWKSPNGTIRSILDGTAFRAPIVAKGIEPLVSNWKHPITVARHAYGDVYKNVEIAVEGDAVGYLSVEYADGRVEKKRSQSLKARDFCKGSTIWKSRSGVLPIRASLLHCRPNRICGSPPRTRSPKYTITASKTSLRKSTKKTTKEDSKPPASRISIR